MTLVSKTIMIHFPFSKGKLDQRQPTSAWWISLCSDKCPWCWSLNNGVPMTGQRHSPAHIYKANLEVKQTTTKTSSPSLLLQFSSPFPAVFSWKCTMFLAFFLVQKARGATGVGMSALEDGTLAPVECGGRGALDCGGLWPLGSCEVVR